MPVPNKRDAFFFPRAYLTVGNGPHEPAQVEPAEEAPGAARPRGPEGLQKGVAHQADQQPVTLPLQHPARVLGLKRKILEIENRVEGKS